MTQYHVSLITKYWQPLGRVRGKQVGAHESTFVRVCDNKSFRLRRVRSRTEPRESSKPITPSAFIKTRRIYIETDQCSRRDTRTTINVRQITNRNATNSSPRGRAAINNGASSTDGQLTGHFTQNVANLIDVAIFHFDSVHLEHFVTFVEQATLFGGAACEAARD